MKRLLMLFIVLLVLMFVLPAHAVDDEKLIASAEKVVVAWDKLLQGKCARDGNAVVIYGGFDTVNLDGVFKRYVKEDQEESTYNIIRTSSVTSPYTLSINFGVYWGGVNHESAVKGRAYLHSNPKKIAMCGHYELSIVYAYQKGHWVLKPDASNIPEKFYGDLIYSWLVASDSKDEVKVQMIKDVKDYKVE